MQQQCRTSNKRHCPAEPELLNGQKHSRSHTTAHSTAQHRATQQTLDVLFPNITQTHSDWGMSAHPTHPLQPTCQMLATIDRTHNAHSSTQNVHCTHLVLRTSTLVSNSRYSHTRLYNTYTNRQTGTHTRVVGHTLNTLPSYKEAKGNMLVMRHQ
jgi:hypothetical protein